LGTRKIAPELVKQIISDYDIKGMDDIKDMIRIQP
jgi:hypothetical protein